MTIHDCRRVVIASKHLGLVGWLQRHHPELAAKAIYDPGVRANSVTSNTGVIGTWPTQIIAAAAAYCTVEFQTRPRQPELTPDDMDAHGAYLKQWYLLDDAGISAIEANAIKAYKETHP